MNTSQQVLQILTGKAKEKAAYSVLKTFLLGIMAGAFIGLGYMAFIRITAVIPSEWGTLSTFLGGAVFPIGLVCIVFIGGELVTGNMMVMFLGYLHKEISLLDVFKNWIIAMTGNLVGGVLVAYFFGHIVGITEGAYLAKTLAVAGAKVGDTPLVAFVSAIGCNIFVCIAVWMGTAAQTYGGKVLASWFPVMVFVLIGFQHVVANVFIIPAAMFSGASDITILLFLKNILFVFLGNAFGGAICIALPCYLLYREPKIR